MCDSFGDCTACGKPILMIEGVAMAPICLRCADRDTIRELTEALAESLDAWDTWRSVSDHHGENFDDNAYNRLIAIRDKHRKPGDEIGDDNESQE